MFKIGNVEINGKIVLAPMAGISNPAYIKICEEMGLSYAITELISAEAIVRNSKKTFDMLNGIEEIKIPFAVQLFGNNELTLSNAAKIICEKYKNVSIIDINMGCPVPKVVNNGSGSALLKDVDKIRKIVSTVAKSIDVPVTVKIRSGWDKNSINAVEVAKTCEAAGASAITIHARCRSEKFDGHSDWNIIKEVKKNVSIPVIGNGDVKTKEDALKMLNDTSVDAVMVGRALLGNPWLVNDINNYFLNKEIKNITKDDKINMCIKHLNYLLKYKSETASILEMRTHASWYLKGLKDASEVKNVLFKTKNKDEFIEILNNFRNK